MILTIVLAMLLSDGVHAQGSASVSGITVDRTTGAPLANIHVRLIAGWERSYAAVYGTVSNQEGRFSFSHIPPGEYHAWPEDTAEYLFLLEMRNDRRAPDLTLKAGDRVDGLKLYLGRVGVIAGRVVDEDGDPVEGAQVSAVPLQSPSSRIAQIGGSDMTDDRGFYRLICSPGQYRVYASPPRVSGPYPPEVRADGGDEFL